MRVPPMLRVFLQKGCPHCHKAEGYLSDYERKHRGEAMIIRHRIDLYDWHIEDWTPESTPAYALIVGGILTKVKEGIMDVSQVHKFVTQESTQIRRKKRQKIEDPESDRIIDDETEDEPDVE